MRLGWFSAAAALIGLFAASDARALGIATGRAGQVPRQVDDPTTSPAYRYGKLERFQCEAELTRRQVPFTRVASARGVLAPVRLTGPVRGVTFHSNLPARARASTSSRRSTCRSTVRRRRAGGPRASSVAATTARSPSTSAAS
jgi:hypothetical protein